MPPLSLALSQASRDDFVSRDALERAWATIGAAGAPELAGAPYPSYPAGRVPPRALWPFCQPLDAIDYYFGSQLAVYSAFLGWCTRGAGRAGRGSS